MKTLIVEFPDSVNISTIIGNDVVSITKGTTVIAGGTVTMFGWTKNDPASVSPTHVHPLLSGTTGPAV